MYVCQVADWLSGNALVNVVALRRAQLVLGWVTIAGNKLNQATQAYSAWPSLRGEAQWVLTIVAATAREEVVWYGIVGFNVPIDTL